MTFEGKTIARIVDRSDGYSGIDVLFTDGSVLRVEGNGYEDSTVTQIELTPVDRRRELAEAQGRREVLRVRRIWREHQAREEAALEASMSPEEWVAWKDKHRPGWRLWEEIRREVDAAQAEMRRAVQRQFWEGNHLNVNVEVGSVAHIPIDQ